MSKENVLKLLQENVKKIYHLAVEADKQLAHLHGDKKNSFTHIFKQQSAFKNQASTFLPYVEELVADLQAIQIEDDTQFQTLLPNIIVKIELLFKTLDSFKVQLEN
ncbi:hypothetical protein [Psychromonas sp. CD1]|uniref:hypothetical protein n=1 Tax=Psychromonas sp. CD1 TaxID=1979839 RepID=UPI000B9B207E|nr:hypothetical protein [Psychromonas sp. CD1]